MENEEILEKIQNIAKELGFDLVGIANTAISDQQLAISHSANSKQNSDEQLAISNKLDEWIKNGYYADMKWFADSAEKRKDILKVMPEAKSVICVAMNYYNDANIRMYANEHLPDLCHSGGNNTNGRIARYARGRDYHKIFDKKLKLLVKRLEEEILRSTQNDKYEEPKFLYYCDTGPILERAWAARAGLGFIGKNTNLITKYGLWVLLGEIITNINFPNSKLKIPNSNNCGSCRKCLDACPTGALCAPYTVDARKCISYLTIEHKGEIPMELREKIGNRIFGCDACQEVCPFSIGRQTAGENFQKAQDNALPHHFSRYSVKSDAGENSGSGINSAKNDNPIINPTIVGLMIGGLVDGGEIKLREILSIKTNEEFLKKFSGSALMRAKRRGLVRNACIATGNSKDKSLLPYLKECAKDRDSIIAGAAKWAIEKIEYRS